MSEERIAVCRECGSPVVWRKTSKTKLKTIPPCVVCGTRDWKDATPKPAKENKA
jgi:hypothetical protein